MAIRKDRPGRKHQSIAWRVALAFAAILLAIGAVSVSCVWAIFDIHGRLHALKRDEERARTVVGLASAVRDQYAHVAHTIIIGNDSHSALFRDATDKLHRLAMLVRGQQTVASQSDIDRILKGSKEMEQLFHRDILPMVRAGDRESVAQRHERILELAFQAQEEADSLARRADASMEDLNTHVRATQHGAIVLTLLAHLVALLTSLFVGVYLYRTIARPIGRLSAAAARVSDGDLETEIEIERDDELGRLSLRFNDMVKSTKQHQKKLLQTERLMGLASMSAGIAHELNNPIAVILGYAKLLRRRDSGGDPKMLAAIEEEAERCHQVIEGLLELTRGGVLDSRPVDLRLLVEDVVARLRIKTASSSIAVEIHGRGTAQGDLAKLVQVVTNLLENAFDACGPECKVVVLIDEPEARAAVIDVHDSGHGISAEVRERIFEPFFTTKRAGSGLGLAISRAIARAHGGDVVLLSTSNRGSIFRVTLPTDRGSAT